MRIIVRDNLGKDVTNDREWYINTDGKIFYYTGDIDGPLYVVDNDYTWEVIQDYSIGEPAYDDLLEKAQEYLKELDFVKTYYDVCDSCSNNPKNGGAGICNCILPYMQNSTPYSPTCVDDSSCMVNNIEGRPFIFGKEKSNTENTGVADADRISEAVERTKKYLR